MLFQVVQNRGDNVVHRIQYRLLIQQSIFNGLPPINLCVNMAGLPQQEQYAVKLTTSSAWCH